MKRCLTLFVAVFLWTSAKAEDLSFLQLPSEHEHAIEKILNVYNKECSENLNNMPTQVVYSEDNFQVFKLIQGGTIVTAIEAGFECPGFGFPWSGSSGSPTYLIIDGRIFETARGYPDFFNISDEITLIYLWHGGANCKAHDGSQYPNSRPCFSALYWDNELKVLVSQAAPGQIVEIAN